MYFLRLTKLKPAVESIAAEAWDGFQIAGEEVEKTERVLDVRQGKLCWVAGTIYMEMPLKPNILDDISKDVSFFQIREEGLNVAIADDCLALDLCPFAETEIPVPGR